MKVLLITVAGSSTRFSRSLGKDTLKCVYYEKEFRQCLLYQLIYKSSFDKYVIVGGYKFDELKSAIDKYFVDIKEKIILVENIKFSEYGSGYSLYLGLKSAIETDFDELVFAEGDLWFDNDSFEQVLDHSRNVITYNNDVIDSHKSVVFYFDQNNFPHYIYDTNHNHLQIKQPFLSIYNSGQVWKFVDRDRVIDSFDAISECEWQGTNLVYIQKYYGDMKIDSIALVNFKQWLNCNTVEDFRKIPEE